VFDSAASSEAVRGCDGTAMLEEDARVLWRTSLMEFERAGGVDDAAGRDSAAACDGLELTAIELWEHELWGLPAESLPAGARCCSALIKSDGGWGSDGAAACDGSGGLDGAGCDDAGACDGAAAFDGAALSDGAWGVEDARLGKGQDGISLHELNHPSCQMDRLGCDVATPALPSAGTSAATSPSASALASS